MKESLESVDIVGPLAKLTKTVDQVGSLCAFLANPPG